jgi:hypothetical protein
MPSFEVKVDQTQLEDAKRVFSGFPDLQKKVHYRALNQTMTGVRTDMVNASEKILTVEDKSNVKDAITINKATMYSPSANVKGTGKPIKLGYFIVQQVAGGVLVKVMWGKAAKLIRHAFIATIAKTGHKGVYWRKKQDSVKSFKPGFPYASLPKKYRFPINELYGPSVADSLKNPGVIDDILDKADDRLHKAYDSVLDDEMRKF